MIRYFNMYKSKSKSYNIIIPLWPGRNKNVIFIGLHHFESCMDELDNEFKEWNDEDLIDVANIDNIDEIDFHMVTYAFETVFNELYRWI